MFYQPGGAYKPRSGPAHSGRSTEGPRAHDVFKVATHLLFLSLPLSPLSFISFPSLLFPSLLFPPLPLLLPFCSLLHR